VKGRRGCETSRLPYFLENRLTYGGKISALRADRPLPPGRFLVLISVKSLSRPQGHCAAGRIGSIENSNDLIGGPDFSRPLARVIN
jgi:hypothetical protein